MSQRSIRILLLLVLCCGSLLAQTAINAGQVKGGTGGTGTPCKTTAGAFQFNNAGAFGCASVFTFDGVQTATFTGIFNSST